MQYMFRRPQFPVIVVVSDRVFRVLSPVQLRNLLQRELTTPSASARLLDATWEWFEILAEEGVIAPSFVDRRSPTKQAVIALVNGRSNRAAGTPVYEARSLANRTRDEVFTELVGLLPAK